MKVISTIENYQATKGCSLTIGTFDGVHVGHREIIERLVKSAREKNHLAVVLTFFPHPRMVLQKDTSIRLIDTLKEKERLLASLGVDVLVIHPFSKEFSRQTADEFTRDILVKAFNIEHLIIGYDHRFGRNREATVDDLINAGETYGFTVEKIEAQEIASVNVSSTLEPCPCAAPARRAAAAFSRNKSSYSCMSLAVTSRRVGLRRNMMM